MNDDFFNQPMLPTPAHANPAPDDTDPPGPIQATMAGTHAILASNYRRPPTNRRRPASSNADPDYRTRGRDTGHTGPLPLGTDRSPGCKGGLAPTGRFTQQFGSATHAPTEALPDKPYADMRDAP
jgi:hypothetical protein